MVSNQPEDNASVELRRITTLFESGISHLNATFEEGELEWILDKINKFIKWERYSHQLVGDCNNLNKITKSEKIDLINGINIPNHTTSFSSISSNAQITSSKNKIKETINSLISKNNSEAKGIEEYKKIRSGLFEELCVKGALGYVGALSHFIYKNFPIYTITIACTSKYIVKLNLFYNKVHVFTDTSERFIYSVNITERFVSKETSKKYVSEEDKIVNSFSDKEAREGAKLIISDGNYQSKNYEIEDPEIISAINDEVIEKLNSIEENYVLVSMPVITFEHSIENALASETQKARDIALSYRHRLIKADDMSQVFEYIKENMSVISTYCKLRASYVAFTLFINSIIETVSAILCVDEEIVKNMVINYFKDRDFKEPGISENILFYIKDICSTIADLIVEDFSKGGQKMSLKYHVAPYIAQIPRANKERLKYLLNNSDQVEPDYKKIPELIKYKFVNFILSKINMRDRLNLVDQKINLEYSESHTDNDKILSAISSSVRDFSICKIAYVNMFPNSQDRFAFLYSLDNKQSNIIIHSSLETPAFYNQLDEGKYVIIKYIANSDSSAIGSYHIIEDTEKFLRILKNKDSKTNATVINDTLNNSNNKTNNVFQATPHQTISLGLVNHKNIKVFNSNNTISTIIYRQEDAIQIFNNLDKGKLNFKFCISNLPSKILIGPNNYSLFDRHIYDNKFSASNNPQIFFVNTADQFVETMVAKRVVNTKTEEIVNTIPIAFYRGLLRLMKTGKPFKISTSISSQPLEVSYDKITFGDLELSSNNTSIAMPLKILANTAVVTKNHKAFTPTGILNEATEDKTKVLSELHELVNQRWANAKPYNYKKVFLTPWIANSKITELQSANSDEYGFLIRNSMKLINSNHFNRFIDIKDTILNNDIAGSYIFDNTPIQYQIINPEHLDFNYLTDYFCSFLTGFTSTQVDFDKHLESVLKTVEKGDNTHVDLEIFDAVIGKARIKFTITYNYAANTAVCYVNGKRIRREEAREVVRNALCFNTQEEYDTFVSNISKISFRGRHLIKTGIKIDVTTAHGGASGIITFFMEFDKLNGSWVTNIRDTDGKIVKTIPVTNIQPAVNMSAEIKKRRSSAASRSSKDFSNFLNQIGKFSLDDVMLIKIYGIKAFNERIAKSRKYLEDTVRQVKAEYISVTEGSSGSIDGYRVKGTSGASYIVACSKDLTDVSVDPYKTDHGTDKFGAIYSLPSLNYVCVVDRSRDQSGYDVIAGRLLALRNDTITQKNITTLAQHVRQGPLEESVN